MMLRFCIVYLVVLLAAGVYSQGQQYDDYPDYQDYANDYESQDGLYQEYADRQEQKAVA